MPVRDMLTLCYRNTEAHPFKRPKAGGDEIPRYYR